MLTYIGIDPGRGGALAFIQQRDDKTWGSGVTDTPTVSDDDKDAKNRGYDEEGMARLLKPIIDGNECYAAMERVNSMDHDGHVGAFSFGYGWGLWRGILATLAIPTFLVDPRKWKNDFALGYTPDYGERKERARQKALAMFPDCGPLLVNKGHHDRAEALLICEWNRRRNEWVRHNNKPFDLFEPPPAVPTAAEDRNKLPPWMEAGLRDAYKRG